MQSGNYLASTSTDSRIKLWDLREGRLLYTMEAHVGAVNCVEFSPNGEFFSTGGMDELVMIWKSNLPSSFPSISSSIDWANIGEAEGKIVSKKPSVVNISNNPNLSVENIAPHYSSPTATPSKASVPPPAPPSSVQNKIKDIPSSALHTPSQKHTTTKTNKVLNPPAVPQSESNYNTFTSTTTNNNNTNNDQIQKTLEHILYQVRIFNCIYI